MVDPLKSSLEQRPVEKCRAGDREEFHVIVSMHSAALFKTAYGITGNYSLAEDAVQEAFARAWKKFNTFRPGTSLRNWLMRILVNRVIDLIRRKQLPTIELSESTSLTSPTNGPEESLLSLEDHQQLDSAISKLSTEQRVVVVLRFYEQLTVKEIASATGWREGTVKSRLSRAMATLRDILGEVRDDR